MRTLVRSRLSVALALAAAALSLSVAHAAPTTVVNAAELDIETNQPAVTVIDRNDGQIHVNANFTDNAELTVNVDAPAPDTQHIASLSADFVSDVNTVTTAANFTPAPLDETASANLVPENLVDSEYAFAPVNDTVQIAYHVNVDLSQSNAGFVNLVPEDSQITEETVPVDLVNVNILPNLESAEFTVSVTPHSFDTIDAPAVVHQQVVIPGDTYDITGHRIMGVASDVGYGQKSTT